MVTRSIEQLVIELDRLGVELRVEAGQLHSRAPKASLTPTLRAEIAARKTELMDFLLQSAQTQPNQPKTVQPFPRTASIPLSPMQQSLWLLMQIHTENTAYNEVAAFQLDGIVDVTALEQAFAEIVRRHEALRTTFVMNDQGAPIQQINPPNFMLHVVDLSHLPTYTLNTEIERLANVEKTTAFELTQGPLLRVKLLRRQPSATQAAPTDTSYVLLITVHHLIIDVWSFGILLQELATLYAAFAQGRPSPLPDLPIQYADYAIWQQKQLTEAATQEHLHYWQAHLAGAPQLLPLPTDRPRPAQQSFQGSHLRFIIDPECTRQLRLLAQQTKTTLFMVILAAFNVLLARYSQQDDIVIGAPIANRQQQEVASLIGFFANTIVLRTQLAGNPTFRNFLTQVRTITHDAYSHQDIPFEQLIATLQPTRTPSYSPLFQVMFAFQNVPTIRQLDMTSLNIQPFALALNGSKYDLTLTISEEEETLAGSFEYSTDLFEAATIERLDGHFQTLLAGIVANPDQHIADLLLLTEAERHQLLVEWNNTATEYPQDKCIHQLFEEQVARTPDAVAVVMATPPQPSPDWGGSRQLVEQESVPPPSWGRVGGGSTLTYRELNACANQLAHYLQGLGVGPEVLVGLCVERSLEMVVGLLAILKAGGAYVPLDPMYPQERLAFMLQDSNVAVLLTQKHLHASLHSSNVQAVYLDTLTIAEECVNNPTCDVSGENLVYVMYTSGSTGRPKGVQLTHRALSNLFRWHQNHQTLGRAARTAQFTPISFDVSNQEMFATWSTGGTLVLLSEETRRDPLAFLRFLSVQKIERLFLPFVALQQLAEIAIAEEFNLSLREIITAGEQLHVTPAISRLCEREACLLHNHYGPTESHVVTTFSLTGDSACWPNLPPIGRPVANTQIYVLDAALQPVPIGVAGELHIGGIQVGRGYLNRPELTMERFIANPFGAGRLYKTGDLARWLPDGNLEYLGRIDHQVKIRGFRIELGEIEAVLAQHPVVQEAVVVAREDTLGEKRLVAYIIPDKETRRQEPALSMPKGVKESGPDALALSELRSYLQSKLPEYMVPSAFVALDALPLTPNGKVDRKALPAPERQMERSSVTRPRTLTEQQLVRIWEDLLAIHPIGIEDRFFDLGGHSLLAVQLLAKIQHAFGQTLPLRTLFAHPTIAELAMALQRGTMGTITTSLVALQPRGDRAPLYCLPGAGGGVLYLYPFAQALGDQQPVYALESLGLDGKTPPFTTVVAAAAYQVQQLQDHQPQGPYALAGHSYGGFVVYAMAQQLHKAGAAVSALCILDTGAPTGKAQPMDEVGIILLYERLFLEEYGLAPTLSETQLLPLTSEERLLAFKAALEAAKFLPPNSDLDQVRGIVNVVAADLQAAAYLPSDFVRLPIHLFVATDDERSAEATQALIDGWRHYGEVTVHETPGTHTTMMYPPHVQVLAEKVNAVLQGSTTALN